MDELVAELKRIAQALEEQNHLYVERFKEVNERDLEYEQRRFQHDLEVVDAQHAVRREALEIEHKNLLMIHQLYAEHPELIVCLAALEAQETHQES